MADNDGFFEKLEVELSTNPELMEAANEHLMGHSHEGMVLNDANQCLVCGLREALRTLLAISQWLADQYDKGDDTYDVSTIVMSMVGSASDLAMLAKVCSLSGSILNLIGGRSAGMLLEVLQKDVGGSNGSEG